MELHGSGFVFEERGQIGEDILGGFDKIGELWGSLVAKANAMGLDVRNLTRSPKHGEGSVIRFSMNLGHSEFWSQGLIHCTGTRMALGAKSCPILANRGVV